MYTVIGKTRNINIEAALLLLETTSTEKRSKQYHKLSTLLYRYQYFDDVCQSESLYLAYITRVFLTSSPTKLQLRSYLSEYLTPKLPPHGILMLLIVAKANVWP